MRLNVPRLVRGCRRLLAGRFVPMDTLAVEKRVLGPEAEVEIPPAIHLPGALDRLISVSPWRPPEIEFPLITGGPKVLEPTRSWTVRNVDIVGPTLYSGPAALDLGEGSDPYLLPDMGPRVTLDEAHLVTTFGGSRFFGCYFLDDLTREIISGDPSLNLSIATKFYEHEADYRRMLDLPAPRRVTRARIGRLTAYEEPSNNPYRGERYRVLRKRMEATLGPPPDPGPLVYLKRGSTGELRAVANEPELEELLDHLGFDIVEPSRLTAEEIARRTHGARIVMSVEGSHLSHIQFTLGAKGTLLVLQPPDRLAMLYKEFTDSQGMRFAFLVGEPADTGFSIPLDEVRAILDMLA